MDKDITKDICNKSAAGLSASEYFAGEDFSGMDKLDIIFAMQEKFDTDVMRNRGLENITPEEWIQKQTLAMLSELAELIAEVNFKWWKNPRPVNPDNVREELVDILHFFVGMCNRSGMGSEELFSRYIKKNEENFKRQYGKSAKHGYELDGCAAAPAGGSDGGAE